MKKLSWKTTLCGIIGLLLLGAAKTPGCPDWLCHILGLLGGAAPSVGLLFARDNNRTSEDVGAKVKQNGAVLITTMTPYPQPSIPPPDQPPARPGEPTKPPPAYPGDGPSPMPLPPKDEPPKPPVPSPKT